MRKKLESLPLSVLKEIAKDKQVKHYSTLKKAELIDILVKLADDGEIAEDEADAGAKQPENKAEVQAEAPKSVSGSEKDIK